MSEGYENQCYFVCLFYLPSLPSTHYPEQPHAHHHPHPHTHNNLIQPSKNQTRNHPKPIHRIVQQVLPPHPGPPKSEHEIDNMFFVHGRNKTSIDIANHPNCVLLESQNCASIAKHKKHASKKKAHAQFPRKLA